MRIEKIKPMSAGCENIPFKIYEHAEREQFNFKAGQFGEYSVFGEGESTFCIASSADAGKNTWRCTFRQAGRVTSALAAGEEGDVIGFRGPVRKIFSARRMEREKIFCSSPEASHWRR